MAFDHRRELSVLQTPSYFQRNSPSSGVSPAATNGMSAVTPISAVSNNGTSGGPPFFNNVFDSNNQSDQFQLSPQFYRPGTAPGTSSSNIPLGSDSYFPDDRRPSVASVITNASSTGSKTSLGRSGRSIYKRIFGDDNSNDSPGSSESSLQNNRDLPRPNAPYARPATPTSSRPRTPLPSSEIVPFLYQDIGDIPKFGEAPIRSTPVLESMRYDGSDDPQPSSSSHRLHLGRRKDKDRGDRDKELPPRPNTKDSFSNKDHRKELGRIEGISSSSHSSQSRLERPGSPTPSIASSMSNNNAPKSPGPGPPKKSLFGSFPFSKRRKEEAERSETPPPVKIKHQRGPPEPIQISNSPHKHEVSTPKRGSASGGTGSSVTLEYEKYIHPQYPNPRAYDYANVEEQRPRKNLTGTVAPPIAKAKMKRGHSNESGGGRKIPFIGKKAGDGGPNGYYPLDTNLGDMNGIITRPLDTNLWDMNGIVRPEMTPPQLQGSMSFLTPDEPYRPGNISGLSATAPDAAWKVPDSWQYAAPLGETDEEGKGESPEDDAEAVETPGIESQKKSGAQVSN